MDPGPGAVSLPEQYPTFCPFLGARHRPSSEPQGDHCTLQRKCLPAIQSDFLLQSPSRSWDGLHGQAWFVLFLYVVYILHRYSAAVHHGCCSRLGAE